MGYLQARTGDAVDDVDDPAHQDDPADRNDQDIDDLDEARREPTGPADDNGTSATVVEFRWRDRTRPSKPATPVPDRANPQLGAVDRDPLAEYGPPATMAAAELEDGELVELDERWVVIESIEPDLFKGSDYVLAWRSIEVDSDEEGTVILPGESQLRSRSLDDVEDDSERPATGARTPAVRSATRSRSCRCGRWSPPS